MSNIGQVRIGKTTYNIAQADAISQKKLMTLIGGRILMNSAAGQVEKINEQLVYGVLLTIGEDVVDQIASIVLYKTVVSGGKDLITIDHFQNNIHEYFMLVAMAIEVNLSDFFIYLDSANAETRASNKSVNH